MQKSWPSVAVCTSALMWLLAACSSDDKSPMQPVTMTPTSGASGSTTSAGQAGLAAGSGGATTAGAAGMAVTAGASGALAGTGGGSGMPSAQAGASGGAGMSTPPTAGAAGEPAETPDAGMTADGSMPPSAANCLKGDGDYTEAGPYTVKSKTVSIGSKGMYTIFYPDPLETACPHPIVAWGNGTTITGGTAYDHYHEHAGSYGIVTIASHNSNVGDGTFHRAGIDYLLEQNKAMDSEFFGKLSTRAGVSGHSQGGAGGDRASDHPNVEANVNVQGSFGSAPPGDAALLCLTGTEDIQPTGCPRAVEAAKAPAVSANWAGADHVATTLREGEGSDQYARLYTAWFRCFLADDQNACAMFKGGRECPVCKEEGWEEIFANNY